MKDMRGACGGAQIWNKFPLRHWCRATEEEAVMGRLSGAKMLDKWLGYPQENWEPMRLFMRMKWQGLDNFRPRDLGYPKGEGDWAVVRLNSQCPKKARVGKK